MRSNCTHIESSVIELESSVIELESSVIKLESSAIQLERYLMHFGEVQLESSLINWRAVLLIELMSILRSICWPY